MKRNFPIVEYLHADYRCAVHKVRNDFAFSQTPGGNDRHVFDNLKAALSYFDKSVLQHLASL